MTAGFWLIVAIFSLGLAWPITSAITWAMRWIDDRIAGDLTLEETP